MLLTLDVGNTTVTLGLYEREDLRAKWQFATEAERLEDEFGVLILSLLRHESLSETDLNGAVIGCIVPHLEPAFDQLCRRYFKVVPLHVTASLYTGLRILYDTPHDLGVDRVADAFAAMRVYGPPLVVVDLGTAAVFNAITKEGDFLGGAIAHGPGIAAEALYGRAAKLYRVAMNRPKSVIGHSTTMAIQSGILLGYIGLIEGTVRRMKEELGGLAKVIGTGGYAELIGRETNMIDQINPELTLEG